MLMLSFLIFLTVAVGGDVLAVQAIRKRPIPMMLTRGHMVAAAVGLVVLLATVLSSEVPTAAWVGLLVFASGFGGGLFFFGYLFRGKRAPIWAIAAHGSLGWTGVVALAFAIWG